MPKSLLGAASGNSASDLEYKEIVDSTTELVPGKYTIGQLTGPLTISAHSLADRSSVRIIDALGITNTHVVTLDLGGTIFYTDENGNPATESMPTNINTGAADFTLIRTGNNWVLDPDNTGTPTTALEALVVSNHNAYQQHLIDLHGVTLPVRPIDALADRAPLVPWNTAPPGFPITSAFFKITDDSASATALTEVVLVPDVPKTLYIIGPAINATTGASTGGQISAYQFIATLSADGSTIAYTAGPLTGSISGGFGNPETDYVGVSYDDLNDNGTAVFDTSLIADAFVPEQTSINVVDNLTSTDSEAALAAPQGAALLALITALELKIDGLGTVEHDALDIAGRDALQELIVGDRVFVTDASDDTTVDADWAIYRVTAVDANGSGTGWIKLSEKESLDLIIGTNVIKVPNGSTDPIATLLGTSLGADTYKIYTNLDSSQISSLTVDSGQFLNGVVDAVFNMSDFPAGTSFLVTEPEANHFNVQALRANESEGLITTYVDSSAAATTETFEASTATGVVRLFTNQDLTNTATLAVQPGETLNGVTDGTFLFSNYAAGTQFRADEVTGGWVVSVTGVANQKSLSYVSITDPDNGVGSLGSGNLDLDRSGLLILDDDGLIDIATNRVVVTDAGKYEATFSSTVGSGDQLIYIKKNGIRIANTNADDGSSHPSVQVITDMASGDYFEFEYQSASASRPSVTVKQLPVTESVLAGMVVPEKLDRVLVRLASNFSNASVNEGYQKVPFDTSVHNPHGNFDTTTNSYVAPKDGDYRTDVVLSYVNNGGTSNDPTDVVVRKNGTEDVLKLRHDISDQINANGGLTVTLSGLVPNLVSGDVITVEYYDADDVIVARAEESHWSIEQLPTSSIVLPDALDIEESEVTLLDVTLGTAGLITLDNGLTWDDVVNAYQGIRIEISGQLPNNQHYGSEYFTAEKFNLSTSATRLSMSVLDNLNDSKFVNITDIQTGQGTANYATPIPSMNMRIIGVKAQKTVINTTDIPVQNQENQVNGGLLKWNATDGAYEPYSGTAVSSGADPIRESVFGSYGRGTTATGTSAGNGSTVSVPLNNVVEGGSIAYNSTLRGFDVPDGSVVEINAQLFQSSNVSVPGIHLVTAVNNGDTNVPGLFTGTLPGGITNGYRAFQGIYENNSGVTVTLAATITGGGNTGNSGAGYFQVRQIN